MTTIMPDITKSALIIVDMQNDFVHPKGIFTQLAREHPEKEIDSEFLASTVYTVKRLVEAFRKADRPVVYIAHILKPDYSDAAFPYWRLPSVKERQFIVDGTWGAQILDELKPQEKEHLIIKKGFGGFSNTPLNTILHNLGVNTCIVVGVTTCVCVSTTIRGGVEHNYKMIVVSDATAEIKKEMHVAELKALSYLFADVKTTDEVIEMLESIK